MSLVDKDGKINVKSVIQAIGKRVGVDFDADQILKDVKENMRKLSTCPGPHRFKEKKEPNRIRARYVCVSCMGEVGGVERNWYERGLAHGKRGA